MSGKHPKSLSFHLQTPGVCISRKLEQKQRWDLVLSTVNPLHHNACPKIWISAHSILRFPNLPF